MPFVPSQEKNDAILCSFKSNFIIMPHCVAIGCRTHSGEGKVMKMFPKDPTLRKLWETVVNRGKDWKSKENSFLCEDHFDASQFEKVRVDGKRKLKASAFPTIFIVNRSPYQRKSQPKRYYRRSLTQSARDESAEKSQRDLIDCEHSYYLPRLDEQGCYDLNKVNDKKRCSVINVGNGRADYECSYYYGPVIKQECLDLREDGDQYGVVDEVDCQPVCELLGKYREEGSEKEVQRMTLTIPIHEVHLEEDPFENFQKEEQSNELQCPSPTVSSEEQDSCDQNVECILSEKLGSVVANMHSYSSYALPKCSSRKDDVNEECSSVADSVHSSPQSELPSSNDNCHKTSILQIPDIVLPHRQPTKKKRSPLIISPISSQVKPPNHTECEQKIGQLQLENKHLKEQIERYSLFQAQLLSVFNKDQIKWIQCSSPSKSSFAWSESTVLKCLQLRHMIGAKGYSYLRNIGFPFPSQTTLSKRLEKKDFDPTVSETLFNMCQT